ncbi:hypothetical protein [Chryseobacterium daeguense]|uniref:hypothetical protein n=1 Tax=Chryseobacterium daeguense TaxID=412438 RepID=UPI00040496BE|nr:hypothetical protein [Chryseobacterium daeguense]
MNIKKILANPIHNKPIAVNFINTAPAQTIRKESIKPNKLISDFDEKGREKVELWLSFCSIGTQILKTGTNMLMHLGVINKRDAVHDLITAFGQLRNHFAGNKSYDEKEKQIDDFMFQVLTGSEEHQKRVIKFQESILNKAK